MWTLSNLEAVMFVCACWHWRALQLGRRRASSSQGRPYSSISLSFCSRSAIRLAMRCLVNSSETASIAIWRYFKIFISSSTRSFLWGIRAPKPSSCLI
jgi:hypothetical protein